MLEWYDQPHWRWREDRDDLNKELEQDRQKTKAYKAESFQHQEAGSKFSSVEEAQAYLDQIVSSNYFRNRWGYVRHVEVQAKSHGHANGEFSADGRCRVLLPAWAMVDWVLLHETAHALTPPETGGGHGRFWARSYLELVSFAVSREQGFKLKSAFQRGGVSFSPKRPPSVVSAQCAAARPRTISGRPSKLEFRLAEMPPEGELKQEIQLAIKAVQGWRNRK